MNKFFRVFLCVSLLPCLLEAQTPRLVIPIGHTAAVSSASTSPDGKWVLTSSYASGTKLWEAKGREVSSLPVISYVHAFSPDSRYFLTADSTNTAVLWDLSGRMIQRYSNHDSEVRSVAFAPDGKSVLTGTLRGQLILWNLKGEILSKFDNLPNPSFSADGQSLISASGYTVTVLNLKGEVVHQFEDPDFKKSQLNADPFLGNDRVFTAVALSPDKKYFVTGSYWGEGAIWTWEGVKISPLKGATDVQFSPDGKYILSTSLNGNFADIWDLKGNKIQVFHSPGPVVSANFSADGKSVLISEGNNVVQRDLAGIKIQEFKGQAPGVRSLALSKDNTFMVAGSCDEWGARVWRFRDGLTFALNGGLKSRFGDCSFEDIPVAISPDSKTVLTTRAENEAVLWNLDGGSIQSFTDEEAAIGALAFSADGQNILTGNSLYRARAWSLDGLELQSFIMPANNSSVESAAYSPDGQYVLTGSGNLDNKLRLWDRKGSLVQEILTNGNQIKTVAFSPDSRFVLAGGYYNSAQMWDLKGILMATFSGHTGSIYSVAFSPDGQSVLTGSRDGTSRLWDLKGQEIHRFSGHKAAVVDAVFFSNGKFILTASLDHTIKIWNASSGKELATLIFIGAKDWVVTTPSGLFDASPGAMKRMHYMVGLEVVALEQLKTRYYEPYLLQKVLGYVPGGLRPVDELNNVPLYPEVLEASIKNDLLKVRLKARSGGIGKVALVLDGSDIVADVNPDRKTDFEVNLKPLLGFFSPLNPNRLSLKLYNDKGWLESQDYVLEHSYGGVTARGPNDPAADKPRKSLNEPADSDLEKIHFYALVVGTSKYRDEGLNLKYPEKDAAMFADALRKAGSKLFQDRVEVQLLSTEMEPWPRKEVIRKALFDMKAKATPDDILLVYFSGHGITYPPVSEAGQFYYLTTDIAGDNLKDEAILKTQAIAQDSLMDWVRQIKARKRILIYDACNSGSVVKQFESGAKDLNTDQRRALERMKDRTGMYVLAGSAADKSSYEASNYGHGLLTYSLINGMLTVAARKNKMVELGDLFAFVEEDVERLAKRINREQRPEVIAAESYPIGIIDKDTDIKMPIELPVFVRVNLIDSKKNKDLLGVSKAFNTELDRLSTEKTPSLVFWDVESYEGKYYYIGGQYQAVEGKITGNVSLYLQDTELTTFPISGSADALGKLAKDLLFEVQDYLQKNPGK